MATSIVFFVAHVSAEARDGTNNRRRVRALTAETPNRIPKDMGLARNRGNGHPDENNNINPCIFRRAHGVKVRCWLVIRRRVVRWSRSGGVYFFVNLYWFLLFGYIFENLVVMCVMVGNNIVDSL